MRICASVLYNAVCFFCNDVIVKSYEFVKVLRLKRIIRIYHYIFDII